MANMSYCRFHNTLKDVVDCIEAIKRSDETTESEIQMARAMLVTVLEFCESYGIIEEWDDDALESILGDMRKEEYGND